MSLDLAHDYNSSFQRVFTVAGDVAKGRSRMWVVVGDCKHLVGNKDSKINVTWLHLNAPFDPTAERQRKLACLSPEISYSVRKLSQFLDAPTDTHMLAGLHVLKFLKNHPGQGLFFSSSSPLTLKGYSDSDWGACPDTRRSNTGFFFSLAPHWLAGKARNNQLSQGLHLKQSIEP
ncbi:hypothetical protein L195_g031779 [Trifolium pratense]|uniref:Uncharacterized protein n=1 Tax=Trifolium pratense TaxID=57577 RepID=A0A2K3LBD5_TRIPR|nr:hypothetical protein L195_g031779 [Trifolium pratense]